MSRDKLSRECEERVQGEKLSREKVRGERVWVSFLTSQMVRERVRINKYSLLSPFSHSLIFSLFSHSFISDQFLLYRRTISPRNFPLPTYHFLYPWIFPLDIFFRDIFSFIILSAYFLSSYSLSYLRSLHIFFLLSHSSYFLTYYTLILSLTFFLSYYFMLSYLKLSPNKFSLLIFISYHFLYFSLLAFSCKELRTMGNNKEITQAYKQTTKTSLIHETKSRIHKLIYSSITHTSIYLHYSPYLISHYLYDILSYLIHVRWTEPDLKALPPTSSSRSDA